MKKPTLITKQYIDYHEMIEYIEEKYGFDTRDFLNSLEENPRIRMEAIAKKYPNDLHVLDFPKGSETDWPKDSPEIAKRIQINNEFPYHDYDDRIPYLDFWHIHCDSIPGNGCELYLYLDLESYLEKDQWCKPILDAIRTEFSEYVEDDCIVCWVEW